MWQLADAHYVYGVGVRPHYNFRIRALAVAASFLVLLAGSSLGMLQVSRVVSAATEYAVPKLAQPIKPSFNLAISEPPEVRGTYVQQVIDDWLKAHPKHHWSVSLRGVSTELVIDAGKGDVYAPASLYKLLMVPTMFKQRTLDALTKTRLNGQPLQTCFDKMLLHSDNPCGEAIANQLVGWADIDRNLRAGGYNSIKLNDPNVMTVAPHDMVKFMADFYEGKLTSPAVRDYVLGLLDHQQFRAGIPAGCPGCIVMNKTGDNSKGRHDVAIIKDGELVYALGIFSTDGSYQEMAELTRLIHAAMKS